ncbi:hypothetical protein AYO40_03815 [Planctomycetaceae bacterium SCGC AG-212-D15]|nr:hypothetical protein AYO40_03815 [Planctomycetaceae bacterium SCGC AG-212-D15]
MRRATFVVLAAIALAGLVVPVGGQQPAGPEKKFEDFDKLTKGAKEYEGLFKLYHKDERLFAELPPGQLDQPLLCPIAIARGMGMGGHTLNFGEQWVLVFRRLGDKIHVVRRNVHFQAKKGSPVSKAVETTYTDSVLLSLKIQSINPKNQGILIDLNDIFMRDFADLGMGHFDANRSVWHKVKAFPKNIELEVSATFAGGRAFDDSIIDDRGNTVVIHYGLVKLPEDGYQPRVADDRVGYFLSVVKDFSTDSRDTSFLRYVNRWRLERADTDAKNKDKLSPPKKKIVFWIEKSVPDEYRASVRDGILEWNKAFEKIGFRDAIEVRQQENEDFDPEDINYNTFRWITNDRGYAMGPSRANPLTGEILDADIVFDADMVRWMKQTYQLYRNGQTGQLEEPASLIQATRMGWTLPDPRFLPRGSAALGWNDRASTPEEAAANLRDNDKRTRLWAVRQGICQCGAHKRQELALAAMAMVNRADKPKSDKALEEMIGQAIKEITMHEVGHTLGLRHNFKASTMLKNEELHDTAITRKNGLVGSVMDYSPANIAPKGTKQGDYFTTTIGPYDYWAIEYAYKPLSGGTDGEVEDLQKIAHRGAAPGNDYGTDEDLYGTADPSINVWDLGNDPLKFAQERTGLARELLKDLGDKGAEKGEGYQRVRQAFGTLLGQLGNSAYLASSHIGGEYVHRDHHGDPSGRDPMVPVKAAKQREALKFLQDNILTDQTFQFSPQLLRRLAADRWMHWGNDMAFFTGVEYPIHERVLSIQRVTLNHVYSPDVLKRIQNNELKAEKDEQPLTIAELFRAVNDSVWSDLKPGEKVEGNKKVSTSVTRRNLQREHLKKLFTLVNGGSSSGGRRMMIFIGGGAGTAPPDARSLARMHLRDLQKKIETTLKEKQNNLDDTYRAHLEECQERIAKVLAASVQVSEP